MTASKEKSSAQVAETALNATRRQFLGAGAAGVGTLALASLLSREVLSRHPDEARSNRVDGLGRLPGALQATHHAPTAKRVIYIHLAGAPPQQDLFDHKPLLSVHHGKEAPQSILPERSAFLGTNPNPPTILGSPHPFEQVGGNGLWISDLLPHFKKIVDEVAVVRSVHTDQFNHAPAQLQMYTGFSQLGRPSMGSWLSYGLGSENQDLPAFLVLLSGGRKPSAGASAWGGGFLPSVHQGVECRSAGDRILFLGDPAGMTRGGRRRSLDLLRGLNEEQLHRFQHPETQTRIKQYEMAFRMQASVPGVMDISKESRKTLAAYGAEADSGTGSFANNCLLARRLVESGVRFVQLFDWGWDLHGTGPHDDLLHQMPKKCKEIDQALAALILDLKQRGLLEDTLLVCGGEFGRTAVNEARDGKTDFIGRDHHPGCFTMLMAGGGIRSGVVYGKTDDFGVKVIENPVHVHDLQATILHTLGIDHTQLTYRFQGLDFRLTNFKGQVVRDLLS